MNVLSNVAASTLSLPPDTYIYSIIPTSDALVAISSDDSLSVFDKTTLAVLPNGHSPRVHEGVTCLHGWGDDGNYLVTAGRDSHIRCWDRRSQQSVYDATCSAPVLALSCSRQGKTIAAGTEYTSHQSLVMLWDLRSSTQPLIQYSESHNDDVTDLDFHPSIPTMLLSGSTDGLVNIYDTSIADEEEALYQVFNHGSSIHHAGFMNQQDIYAISHDEIMSIYRLSDTNEDQDGKQSVKFGDVRGRLKCEYVIDLSTTHTDTAVAAVGNHSKQRVDLVPLRKGAAWAFDQDSIARLAGAHSEEIVRSFYIDDQTETVFTAGEDGQVRAWKPAQR